MSLVNVVRLKRMSYGICKSICTACSMIWLQLDLAGMLWKFASLCKWPLKHEMCLAFSFYVLLHPLFTSGKRKEKFCSMWKMKKGTFAELGVSLDGCSWVFLTWGTPGLSVYVSSACVQHSKGSAPLCFQTCLYSSQICRSYFFSKHAIRYWFSN